ncbi:MAG: membrane protein [Saprospiraceae bacterium]|nr:MAG: membrane protein [Saprospiraceae bacterium]
MKKWPIGTFVNMATVTIGSLIGMWLQQVFPPNIQNIIFQAIGLGVLVIGILMSLKIPDGYLLIFIFSLILGGILGELIHLKAGLEGIGDWIKTGFGITDSEFTKGLVTAFLLFCVGSMTIVGAIEEGLRGKRELLLVKSTLDGISSIAFAATYGIGVLFSILPMLLFQGGITVLARQMEHFFTKTIIDNLSAVGGVLILGIGINLLQLGTINIENLLPSLLIVVILTWGYERVRKTEPSPTQLEK